MSSKKHILSFSGGKDSTFLLLESIRRNEPLDEVVFFDTGWEFPVMYEHIEKCKKLCEKHSIKFVTLRPKYSFDYLMFDKPKTKRNGEKVKGNSWCGGNGHCRWGTFIKQKHLNEYTKSHFVYLGICVDEPLRLVNLESHKLAPLAEWGITESQCLQGCYEAGFDWGGMYEHLDRLSCKVCANKNLKELRNIRKYYPEVWKELKDYQQRTDRLYNEKLKYSVFDLEKRFAFEEERTASGLSITSREFHRELKEKLRKNVEDYIE